MKKIVLYIILIIVIIFFLYFIFKDKIPLYNFFHNIETNYDYWAGNFFKFLPLIIVIFTIGSTFFLNPKKRFLKLQASLPTSKIQSIAKGLVEVEGKLIMKEPLISPVGKEECIGYYYVVEDVYKDSDGKYTYHTSYKEQKCNEFEIEDQTGKIKVVPEGIQFVLLKKTHISSSNSERHTETLIKNGQEMLIIGYCDTQNNTPFIRKDTSSKVLGITTSSNIIIWNKYKPLLNSFVLILFAILAVFTLILSS